MKGKLKEDPGYRCAKCVRGGCTLGGAEEQEVLLEEGSSLECANKFCYRRSRRSRLGRFRRSRWRCGKTLAHHVGDPGSIPSGC